MTEVWIFKEAFTHYFTLTRAKFQHIESGHLDKTTDKKGTLARFFSFPDKKHGRIVDTKLA